VRHVGHHDDLGFAPKSLTAYQNRSAPVVLGIPALDLLFEFRIGFTPEERQVLGDLHQRLLGS